MQGLEAAVEFVKANGNELEQLRLRLLLGEQVENSGAVRLIAETQRADGGWAPFWAEASALDSTCFRLAQLEQLDVTDNDNVVRQALQFIGDSNSLDKASLSTIVVHEPSAQTCLKGRCKLVQRVAALYDIHGNLDALEAVLAEVGRIGADVVVIGGDFVWGPKPVAVLERLFSIQGDVRFLRGNTDRWILGRYSSGEVLHKDVPDIAAWCHAQLSDEHRAFLSRLPDTVSLEIEGLGSTLFVHASPRSDVEGILEDAPEADVASMLQDVSESLVVCGHTHVQFERRIAGKRIVNPGSVGLPRYPKGACWALLGPDVRFFATDYDCTRAIERIRESGIPAPEHFIEHLT